MLRVDTTKWKQTPEDLRRASIEAAHPRSRERFLALYDMTQGSCPSRLAEQAGRNAQTLMQWVHWYNERGPEAIFYRHTGGWPPFARRWSGSLPG